MTPTADVLVMSKPGWVILTHTGLAGIRRLTRDLEANFIVLNHMATPAGLLLPGYASCCCSSENRDCTGRARRLLLQERPGFLHHINLTGG